MHGDAWFASNSDCDDLSSSWSSAFDLAEGFWFAETPQLPGGPSHLLSGSLVISGWTLLIYPTYNKGYKALRKSDEPPVLNVGFLETLLVVIFKLNIWFLQICGYNCCWIYKLIVCITPYYLWIYVYIWYHHHLTMYPITIEITTNQTLFLLPDTCWYILKVTIFCRDSTSHDS